MINETGSIRVVSPEVKKVVDAASKEPCALCESQTEWIYSFAPKDPEAFPGFSDGDALYVPLCGSCLSGRNHDPEGFRDFIETFLSKLGTPVEP